MVLAGLRPYIVWLYLMCFKIQSQSPTPPKKITYWFLFAHGSFSTTFATVVGQLSIHGAKLSLYPPKDSEKHLFIIHKYYNKKADWHLLSLFSVRTNLWWPLKVWNPKYFWRFFLLFLKKKSKHFYNFIFYFFFFSMSTFWCWLTDIFSFTSPRLLLLLLGLKGQTLFCPLPTASPWLFLPLPNNILLFSLRSFLLSSFLSGHFPSSNIDWVKKKKKLLLQSHRCLSSTNYYEKNETKKKIANLLN